MDIKKLVGKVSEELTEGFTSATESVTVTEVNGNTLRVVITDNGEDLGYRVRPIVDYTIIGAVENGGADTLFTTESTEYSRKLGFINKLVVDVEVSLSDREEISIEELEAGYQRWLKGGK